MTGEIKGIMPTSHEPSFKVGVVNPIDDETQVGEWIGIAHAAASRIVQMAEDLESRLSPTVLKRIDCDAYGAELKQDENLVGVAESLRSIHNLLVLAESTIKSIHQRLEV